MLYGFCSDATIPRPAVGTIAPTLSNGLAMKHVVNAKNAQAAPRIAITHGIRSWLRLRFCQVTSAESPVSTSSQSSSEPSCVVQNDDVRYGCGTVSDELRQTTRKR